MEEQFEYEVMREQYEEEHAEDTTEPWDITFGTAEEARGDYDHDVQKQAGLDRG